MTTYLIADTHFNHRLMIERQLRPFASVEEMNETLVERWNAVVRTIDEVYVIGDFSLGDPVGASILFGRLNGRKSLIAGNHDSTQVKNFPWERVDWLRQISHNHKRIIMCHFPIESWNGRSQGYLHAHGHIHASPFRQVPNRFNLSAEVLDYRPISLDDLLARAVPREELKYTHHPEVRRLDPQMGHAASPMEELG
jgi:calcineurin-like phosphoesterase family protein